MDASEATFAGVSLKYLSLVVLTVQNSLLTIFMHYSRTHAAPYSASAAVLLLESLKVAISFAIALYNSYQQSPHLYAPINSTSTPYINGSPYMPSDKELREAKVAVTHSTTSADASDLRARGTDLLVRLRQMRKELLSPDCWKLGIPATLYVIQNNLQFIAASNLDVATFQVTYQMKILTTALFSVFLLKRKLSIVKWASLFGLAVGVAIVQLQSVSKTSASSGVEMDPTKGFIAVTMSCFTSGLAGVYFEMVLKGSQADLWIRNIQLATFSLIPALTSVLFPGFGWSSSSSAVKVDEPFLFQNFGLWAWITVLTQVLGGLVTALVIKFSDNIMKGFATSLSILLSFVAGYFLFNAQITPAFVVGCAIVLGSTYVYNKPGPSNPPRVLSTPSHSRDPSYSKLNGLKPSLSSAPSTPKFLDTTASPVKAISHASETIVRRHNESSTGTSTPDVTTEGSAVDRSDQPYFHAGDLAKANRAQAQ